MQYTFTSPKTKRTLIVTPGSDMKMRRAKWLWEGRVAVGTLSVLAGQAGLGKSTLVYWLVAQITSGKLPGEFEGQPRNVIICATEDSWEYTIKPRLVAAGADCSRVLRIDITRQNDGISEELTLTESDHREILRTVCEKWDVALVVFDPLMSRIGNKDSHKDADVRQALEPLVKIAQELRFSVLGIMHHNKSGSSDPLHLVMGSTAFGAVARSVHTVTPEVIGGSATGRILFGTIKNNLGPISGYGEHDLDTLAFRIESVTMETEDDDPQPLVIGRAVIDGASDVTVGDSLVSTNEIARPQSRKQEAADWLSGLFTETGPLARRQVKELCELSEHKWRNVEEASKFDQFAKAQYPGAQRETVWGLTHQIAQLDTYDLPPIPEIQTRYLESSGGAVAPDGNGTEPHTAVRSNNIENEPNRGVIMKTFLPPSTAGIPGLPDYYCNDRGEIFRRSDRWGGPSLLIQSRDPATGDIYVVTNQPREETRHSVAQLVLETFQQRQPAPEFAIRYLDDDSSNCALSNLRWVRAI